MTIRRHAHTARSLVLTCLLFVVAGLGNECWSAPGDDWPCFRGSNRDGISTQQGLPLTWQDSEGIVWKTRLPGAGASSPVTWGNRIYLTCYSGYGLSRQAPGKYEDLQRHVVCLSRADGKILWDKSFANKVPDDHYGDFINLHGYASSTPAVDDSGVYVFFGTSGVQAYRHDGELKWVQPCGEKYTNFGSASSPVLFGNLVIVNAAVECQTVLAFDKQTGTEAWRVKTLGMSRSTPLLLKTGKTHELVYHLGEWFENDKGQPSGLGAVDPRTGKVLWKCISIDAYLNPSPIAGNGVIYAIGGNDRGVAIRPGGRNDVTATHKLWEIRHGSEVCTPLYHDGHLYWTNEASGIAFCINAASGKVIYQERLEPRPDRIYASGVMGDGKLYYVSREHGTFVLAAKPEYELLAHNVIESDESVFNATPAISRGQLLLRSDQSLYCIGRK